MRASGWRTIGVMLLAASTLLGTAAVSAQQPARHTARGLVLAVDASRRNMLVSHDAIDGVMPAMTMRFDVKEPNELSGLKPGTTVRFTLVIGRESAHAESIRIVRYQSLEQDPFTARRLKLLTDIIAPRPAPIAAGEMVPDFTLTDQVRRRVSLASLRGKVVAINFIYTSCALPQFCFRMANHFGVVQKRFASRMGRDLVLLTVTFDPARDTPEKLAAYAQQWKANPDQWHFLTGSASEIQRACGMFGVDFFPEEGLMNHSTHTAVIDRQGRLVANIEGNEVTAAQIGDLVQTVLR